MELDVTGTAMLTLSTLGLGHHAITAVYAGGDRFLPSTSAAIDKVILPATTVKLVALPPTTVFGQTVALTATVRPIAGGSAKPGGLVTFRDGDCVLGTAALVNGVATLKVPRLSVGTQRLTASYAGNGAFAASEASPINVIVWPARHGVVRRR